MNQLAKLRYVQKLCEWSNLRRAREGQKSPHFCVSERLHWRSKITKKQKQNIPGENHAKSLRELPLQHVSSRETRYFLWSVTDCLGHSFSLQPTISVFGPTVCIVACSEGQSFGSWVRNPRTIPPASPFFCALLCGEGHQDSDGEIGTKKNRFYLLSPGPACILSLFLPPSLSTYHRQLCECTQILIGFRSMRKKGFLLCCTVQS